MKNTERNQNLIHGYSYHYYTICHNWSVKGSATDFDKNEWFNTMKKTYYVDENLDQHSEIMDKYDPEKKVTLIADEWGKRLWHTRMGICVQKKLSGPQVKQPNWKHRSIAI